MPSAPYWKLRRLAPRARRVCERRGDLAQVQALAATVVPLADAYIAVYDEAGRYRRTWAKEMMEGRDDVDALLGKLRGWLPLALRDVLAFDATSYGDKPNVPDDVIEDADRLLNEIESTLVGGSPLPWSEAAKADLEPAIASAAKEQAEAEAADSAWQQLQRRVREAGYAFDQDLQHLRRALLQLVGRSDRDYQRLRADRVTRETTEDDDQELPVVEPAPLEATTSEMARA